MAKVITYTDLSSGTADRLLQIVKGVVSMDQVEPFRSIETLNKRLSKALYDVDAVILLAEKRATLDEIINIIDLLRFVSVIMVLPDRAQETISKGYSVWPRYVSYLDSDLSEIAVVLKKMVSRSV